MFTVQFFTSQMDLMIRHYRNHVLAGAYTGIVQGGLPFFQGEAQHPLWPKNPLKLKISLIQGGLASKAPPPLCIRLCKLYSP